MYGINLYHLKKQQYLLNDSNNEPSISALTASESDEELIYRRKVED